MNTRSNGRRAAVLDDKRQGAHVSEMQRRRLLLAMGEVVGESGLEAAGVGHVCERAGVSRRTFYELFEDREACLLAAFEAQIERLAESAQGAYVVEGRWRERIRRALTVLLEQLDSQPVVARLCVVETLRAGSQVLERRRRVLEVLAVAVDEGRVESRAGSEPPPLTAQGIVGGASAVIHARLLELMPAGGGRPLVELTGPLMAMITHPYLGATAARKELEQPVPVAPRKALRNGADPFKDLPIRFTYRTARVISTIAGEPGASNRLIADSSGVADEGQISRLLGRLSKYGLIENRGEGQAKGESNAWMLTDRGRAVHEAIAVNTVEV